MCVDATYCKPFDVHSVHEFIDSLNLPDNFLILKGPSNNSHFITRHKIPMLYPFANGHALVRFSQKSGGCIGSELRGRIDMFEVSGEGRTRQGRL